MTEINNQQNQQNSLKTNDEIDIFELFSKIWKSLSNFFSSIKEFFIAFIIFTIRKVIWVGSFALIGLLVGYF